MTKIMVAESGDVTEALDMDKAKEVGDTLSRHYPQYMWLVSFQGGVLVVKLGQISASTLSNHSKLHGFVIKHQDSYSASDLARQAVMAGGELLERCGLKRGSWDGTMPTHMDLTA